MLVLIAAAFASSLQGDYLLLHYGSAGAWTDTAAGVGLLAELGGSSVDFLNAGDVYQLTAVGYTVAGQERAFGVGSSVGNDFLYLGEDDLSAGSTRSMAHTWQTGELELVRTETFDERDLAMVVTFSITNRGSVPLTDLRVLFGFDPDQDAAAYSDYSTANGVRDADGDGVDDWASATGPTSGWAIGIGACDVYQSAEGFWADWQGNDSVDATLTDPDGAASDSAMGLVWFAPDSLAAGSTVAYTLIVAIDETEPAARDSFRDLSATACCDGDGDGVVSEACGGGDCDDRDPGLLPGATDVPYDGVDQDCSGADQTDLDGDGEAATQAGGRDCDDGDGLTNSSTAEVWYDGVDQNCDGNDDDQDLDGAVLAYDCDDEDPSIQVDCPEPDTDDGAVVTEGGCGCQTATGPGWAVGLALAALAMRRK